MDVPTPPASFLDDHAVVLTNGPAATIGEILSVGLARSRDRIALAEDPAYVPYRASVLELLYRRHGMPGEKKAA